MHAPALRPLAAGPELIVSPPSDVLVDGVRVHHVDAGPRDADCVLLLPGIISTHRYFARNLAALAARHRVLAPDLPGFGRSDKPDAPYTIDWFAAHVAGFLALKGVRRAHVVGNSMGGQIALQLAAERPALVDKLVLVAPAGRSTGHFRLLAPLLAGLEASRVFERGGARRLPAIPTPVLAGVFRAVFPHDPHLAARWTRGYARAIAGGEYPLYLRALVRSARGVIAAPTSAHAAQVKQPTLIVWGARDLVVPTLGAKRFARRIPHARLLVYERSGHVPMADQPERFNRDLLEFLSS